MNFFLLLGEKPWGFAVKTLDICSAIIVSAFVLLFSSSFVLAMTPEESLLCGGEVVAVSGVTSEAQWTQIGSETLRNLKRNWKAGHNRNFFYSTDYFTDHIKVMESILGFGDPVTGSVPSLEQIVSSYEKQMTLFIKNGLVEEKDILRPAFVFLLKGKYIWLRYGDPIPPGANRKWMSGLLPSDIYNKMLSDGYFPMGEDIPVGTQYSHDTYFSAIEHDLAHLTGFLENPVYMKLIRQLAEAKVTQTKDEILGNANPSYYFSETMVALRKNKIDELLGYLLLPPGAKDPRVLTLSSIEEDLLSRPFDEVKRLARFIFDNYDIYFEAFGGAAREWEDGSHHDFFRNIIPYMSPSEEPNAALLIKNVARLELSILWLNQLTLDDWYQAALAGHAIPKTDLHKFIWRKRLSGPTGV